MQKLMTALNRNTIVLACLLALVSCNTDVANKFEAKSTALGKMNEIVVICDDDLWESSVSDTFNFYFGSAFPILPQPESMFDIRQFSPTDLIAQPLRKELRTYVILADISDEDSPTTQMVKKDVGSESFEYGIKRGEKTSSVGRDKWAKNQLLVYLFGTDRNALNKSITQNFGAVAKRVHQHDKMQLKSSVYVDRTNIGLTNKIKENYNVELQVPGEYKLVTHDLENETLWLRKDTKKAIMNIVLRKEPYKNESQLSKQGIIELRDAFGKQYVTSDEEEDFMVVDSENLPVYEYDFKMGEHYAKELRGIWEMTKSFSGGPFNTYAILNKEKNEIVYIDVFVLAPGSEKRNMMMQLDYIVKNSKIITESE